jgi:hypothetical protein
MHTGENWWDGIFAECANDGARDAENGRFIPPYPGSDDPQDLDLNAAYEFGFKQRRKELGDAFKWA